MSKKLARDKKVDVSADGDNWVSLYGIDDLADSENATLQAADTYDTDGFNSFEKTMTGGKLVAKVYQPATSPDPGQELCRATRFAFGAAARVYVRWYDRNGGPEAYSMLALVDWNPSKTGVGDLAEITITFTADGVVSKIDNPGTADAKPVLISATPAGVAASGLVTITGAGFVGTTGVKFGATAAAAYQVVSDSLIVASMPAGSAGAANVTVTNGVGTSDALSYTRGA